MFRPSQTSWLARTIAWPGADPHFIGGKIGFTATFERSVDSWRWCFRSRSRLTIPSGHVAGQNQLTQPGQGFIGASQAIITAVEHKLDEAVAFGRALSSSSPLVSGDLKSFEEEARKAGTGFQYWLVLNAPESGRRVVNTTYS